MKLQYTVINNKFVCCSTNCAAFGRGLQRAGEREDHHLRLQSVAGRRAHYAVKHADRHLLHRQRLAHQFAQVRLLLDGSGDEYHLTYTFHSRRWNCRDCNATRNVNSMLGAATQQLSADAGFPLIKLGPLKNARRDLNNKVVLPLPYHMHCLSHASIVCSCSSARVGT